MPTLVITGPDGAAQEHDFTDEATIGRSAEGNTLVLTGGGVSRRHARFVAQGASVQVEDVGSANGTFVDGKKIAGPTAVSPASQIAIGDYRLTLKAPPRAARGTQKLPGRGPEGARPAEGVRGGTRQVPVARGPGPAGAGALARRPPASPERQVSGTQLRGLTGAFLDRTFPLKGTLTVGRVAPAEVLLEDDSVSRKHAELEVRARQVYVRDLNSANGTAVNGTPIVDETKLNHGDIVQFGVVELQLETAAGARLAAAGALAPSSGKSLRGRPEEELPVVPPADANRRRLLIGAGVLGGLLVLAGLVKALTPDETPASSAPVGRPSSAEEVLSDDPEERLEQALARCRSYATGEGVAEPNWVKAKEACQAVLDLEPIHVEAGQLFKRVELSAACQTYMAEAKELYSSGRLDEALESWAKVRPECPQYFLRAVAAAKEPLEEVKRVAAKDCKLYAENGKWENALKRCEQYARLACQTMKSDDLYGPPGTKLRLEGPLGRNEWRPSDRTYFNFLKARERLTPGGGQWACPDLPAFRPPPKPEDPAKRVKDELRARMPDPALGEALVLYFEGKLTEARVPLQKVLENVSKAELHEQARDLMKDVNSADSFMTTGQSQLTNERVDKAEDPFRRALVVDEKLVLGPGAEKLSEEERRKRLDRATSFLRKTVVEAMTYNCYSRGKLLADRKDFKQACKLWKLGLSFSKGNIDLLKAVTNVCTARAAEMFQRADSCEALRGVLDFAVEGDGLKAKVDEQLEALQCSGQ